MVNLVSQILIATFHRQKYREFFKSQSIFEYFFLTKDPLNEHPDHFEMSLEIFMIKLHK